MEPRKRVTNNKAIDTVLKKDIVVAYSIVFNLVLFIAQKITIAIIGYFC